MKQFIKKIIRMFHKEKSRHLWPFSKIVERNMAAYKRDVGHEFDINNPKTFTEKLQNYKLFYKHPDLTEIIDKASFKGYIEKRLGSGNTIPMIGCYASIEELDKAWESLPETFILKSTVSSAALNIKAIKEKSKTDYKQLRKEIKKWFLPENTMMNGYCTGYYGCTPKVLAEEYVSQVDNQLYDYKIFCFDGKPFCFYTAIDHFEGVLSKITFYDLDWNKMDVRYGEHENAEIKPPKHKQQMLEIAKKLSDGFPFVRVDFFDTEDRLYVAEMTFYPGGGLCPYHPSSFDMQMGDMFDWPKKGR